MLLLWKCLKLTPIVVPCRMHPYHALKAPAFFAQIFSLLNKLTCVYIDENLYGAFSSIQTAGHFLILLESHSWTQAWPVHVPLLKSWQTDMFINMLQWQNFWQVCWVICLNSSIQCGHCVLTINTYNSLTL